MTNDKLLVEDFKNQMNLILEDNLAIDKRGPVKSCHIDWDKSEVSFVFNLVKGPQEFDFIER